MQAAEERLLQIATVHPLIAHLTAGGARLVTGQPGVAGALGTILAAVAELAQRGGWDRVKACRNPPCHLGFYDRTRNGSGLYCSPGCGSQVSMRAYRERRRKV